MSSNMPTRPNRLASRSATPPRPPVPSTARWSAVPAVDVRARAELAGALMKNSSLLSGDLVWRWLCRGCSAALLGRWEMASPRRYFGPGLLCIAGVEAARVRRADGRAQTASSATLQAAAHALRVRFRTSSARASTNHDCGSSGARIGSESPLRARRGRSLINTGVAGASRRCLGTRGARPLDHPAGFGELLPRPASARVINSRSCALSGCCPINIGRSCRASS